MPNIFTFLLNRYGMAVYMYFMDQKQHHAPHIHVKYQDEEAVLGIPGGELIEGTLPGRMLRKVRAWIELHDEALMERWSLAAQGHEFPQVD